MTTNSSTKSPMQDRRRGGVEGAWLASGAASVLVFVVALFLLPADPGGHSPADIAARYAGGREGYLRATYFEALSVALFLVFVAALSTQLRRRQTGTGPLPATVATTGAAAATMQLAAYAMIANLAYRTAETGNTDVIMALYDLSEIVFLVALIPLAVFVAAASGGIFRTRAASTAIGWCGYVVAALLLIGGGIFSRTGALAPHGGFGFLALVLFLLWLLAASLALTIRASREARHHEHNPGVGRSVDRGADAMTEPGLRTS
jgi:hypothetical protein